MHVCDIQYDEIISLENLANAWFEFIKGKRNKRDVQLFALHLEENLWALHEDLIQGTYTHGLYEHFLVRDPKLRSIHKAGVRDRLLHHAVYRKLYPWFSKRFIHDSFSCQMGKGTHKAVLKFETYVRCVSHNYTRTAWILKCDIRKFFANIDQELLCEILLRKIGDMRVWGLLTHIIRSFNSDICGGGLPLGNLTSQLLANVYMHEFDRFMKHVLRVKYYIRYADDFVVISKDKAYLEKLLQYMQEYLKGVLKLGLHPNKIELRTLASGIDFLGWVHFPYHRVLRRSTRRRAYAKIQHSSGNRQTLDSYLGLVGHGDAFKIWQRMKNLAFVRF